MIEGKRGIDMENFIPKSAWGPGPWQNEPDRMEWEYKGFPCLMVRNFTGAWCGYVAVPPNHPAYQRNYGDLEVDVHGGLNYSDNICHVPKRGEPDNVWWLGFDCAHAMDLLPRVRKVEKEYIPDDLSFFKKKYRDVDYVKKEVNHLAYQLAKMRTKGMISGCYLRNWRGIIWGFLKMGR